MLMLKVAGSAILQKPNTVEDFHSFNTHKVKTSMKVVASNSI